MNIHTTHSYTLTTGTDADPGALIDVEALTPPAILVESQCTALGILPAGAALVMVASGGNAQLLVSGATVPSGTVLSGAVSTVSATP